MSDESYIDGGTLRFGSDADMVRLLQAAAMAANEADSVEDALATTVHAVCEQLRVAIGHAYLLDSRGGLVPTGIWHSPQNGAFEAFRTVTEQTRFERGEGLPGRVLESAAPVWIRDVRDAPGFVRSTGAAGLGAAFAFPMLVGREVVGVLEFFSDRARWSRDTRCWR